MEKWICKVCGYAHYGPEAPDTCPQCGSAKSEFYLNKKKGGCVISILILFITLAGTLYSCHSSVTVDNSTVRSIDLNQYLGTWYEVARFDHKFERGLQQCTAHYAMKEDGTIQVTNRGKKNGKWKTSVGKAKLTGTPGVLRVSFFGPFYSDYRILMLAPDYSYSLVGGNDDKYLWILSRTPYMRQKVRDDIVKEANRRGYKTENLIWVKQSGN